MIPIKCAEGVMPCYVRSQRTGGRCEPVSGGGAAGAGAGRPNKANFSRASRICPPLSGQRLVGASFKCALRRETGWYRGKEFIVPEQ